MIPVYINHYDVLTERKEYLQTVINDCIWVTEPSKETITQEVIDEWYLNCPVTWNNKCSPLYQGFGHVQLSKGSIVCNMGHVESWKMFLESNQPYGVFLEDDVVVCCPDFQKAVEQILTDVPEDLDVLFIGGGFDHKSVAKTKNIIKNNFHLKQHPSTNCACSYILTISSAKNLLQNIKPFTLPIDFELNYWFYKLNFNVYHYIPYIIQEGSKTGKYTSSQI